jgi:hypothetical protein
LPTKPKSNSTNFKQNNPNPNLKTYHNTPFHGKIHTKKEVNFETQKGVKLISSSTFRVGGEGAGNGEKKGKKNR